MDIRFDYQNKRTLLDRFETMLGPGFLDSFSEFVFEHEMPMGSELAIEWRDAKATAVMFDDDSLLLLRICRKKSDTPCSQLTVGERTFYPAEKIRPIPIKRM